MHVYTAGATASRHTVFYFFLAAAACAAFSRAAVSNALTALWVRPNESSFFTL